MARLSTPSAAPSFSSEASKRLQLPGRKEPRTQASTMFTTTARNLTSNIPFRWRQGQVEIFEDWVRSRGVNAATADLVPLLRELDLDGYENVKNYNGQSVHDLILDKVRRKIARTKGTVVMPVENRKEVRAKMEETQVKVEKGVLRDNRNGVMPAAPVRVEDRSGKPFGPIRPTNTGSKHHHDPTPSWSDDKDTRVNHATVNSWLNDSLAPHGTYQSPPSLIPPKKSLAPTKWLPSPPTDLLSDTASRVSSGRSEHTLHSEARSAPRRHGSRGTGGKRTKRLEVCMEALEKAMEDLNVEISYLDYDDDNALELETYAHDTTIEVDHLGTLVRKYASV
ncbi:hypothetical protein F4678DRAFT_228385 [Xylaria arbuscula]|nr:hypothetical protein F4678DRAFT_228385 [Xylaria arbuscula]